MIAQDEIKPIVSLPLEEAEALIATLTVARAELTGHPYLKKTIQEKQQLLRFRINRCLHYYGLKDRADDGTLHP